MAASPMAPSSRCRPAGATCDPDHVECQGTLACIGMVCAPPRANGEGCELDSDCASARCELAALSTTGTCIPGDEVVGLGDACSPGLDAPDGGVSRLCSQVGYCDQTTRRCVLHKGRGAACIGRQECLGELDCVAGKCQLAAEPMCP
jgi:hypothetical protein